MIEKCFYVVMSLYVVVSFYGAIRDDVYHLTKPMEGITCIIASGRTINCWKDNEKDT